MSTISQSAIGKWTAILNQLGVDQSFLKNSHGPCPICGGRDRFRFDDKNGKVSYFCSNCGAGDGFNLLQKIHGWSFAEAAKRVEAVIGLCQPVEVKKADTSYNEKRLKLIHSGLKKITDRDVAGRYLSRRGVSVLPVNDVYFHSGIDYWHESDAGKPVKVGNFPAMVSIFRDIAGNVCTFHVTYLTQDGRKIDGYPAKKMLPKIRELPGAAIKMFAPGDTLAIGEGIETMLSYHEDTGIPCWAAGNASLLERIHVPETVKNVIIVTDEDKSFTGQMAAYKLAHRLNREVKRVNVVRLLGKGDIWTDRGSDTDYCDYFKSRLVAVKTGVLED
jgi:putative DNA primase/helicase